MRSGFFYYPSAITRALRHIVSLAAKVMGLRGYPNSHINSINIFSRHQYKLIYDFNSVRLTLDSYPRTHVACQCFPGKIFDKKRRKVDAYDTDLTWADIGSENA